MAYEHDDVADGHVADADQYNELGAAVEAIDGRVTTLETAPLVIARRLTADTTPVVSSTTLTTITGLVAPIAANTQALFELYTPYNSNVTADIKIGFTMPAGAVADFGIEYWDTSAVRQSGQSSSPAGGFACGGFAADLWFRAFGSIATAGTAGDITPQFAQNTSNASNTLIRRGAYLRLEVL